MFCKKFLELKIRHGVIDLRATVIFTQRVPKKWNDHKPNLYRHNSDSSGSRAKVQITGVISLFETGSFSLLHGI